MPWERGRRFTQVIFQKLTGHPATEHAVDKILTGHPAATERAFEKLLMSAKYH